MRKIPPLGKCQSVKESMRNAMKYALRESENQAKLLSGPHAGRLTMDQRMEQLERSYLSLFSIMGIVGLFAIVREDDRKKPKKKPRGKKI